MKVRETMGLDNVIPMIPFCRTTGEAEQVLAIMAKNGQAEQAGGFSKCSRSSVTSSGSAGR